MTFTMVAAALTIVTMTFTEGAAALTVVKMTLTMVATALTMVKMTFTEGFDLTRAAAEGDRSITHEG
jgi:hypothetical protein